MKVLRKAVLFFGSVVVTISIVIFVQQLHAGGKRNMDGTNALKGMEIPPIDRMLPDRVETATFALG